MRYGPCSKTEYKWKRDMTFQQLILTASSSGGNLKTSGSSLGFSSGGASFVISEAFSLSLMFGVAYRLV